MKKLSQDVVEVMDEDYKEEYLHTEIIDLTIELIKNQDLHKYMDYSDKIYSKNSFCQPKNISWIGSRKQLLVAMMKCFQMEFKMKTQKISQIITIGSSINFE